MLSSRLQLSLPIGFFTSGFLTKFCMNFSSAYACYLTQPIQIMKDFLMLFSQPSLYFLPPRSKYSSHCFAVKHFQWNTLTDLVLGSVPAVDHSLKNTSPSLLILHIICRRHWFMLRSALNTLNPSLFRMSKVCHKQGEPLVSATWPVPYPRVPHVAYNMSAAEYSIGSLV
jgi:hypothetical protein